MNINSIKIENFRIFKNYEIEFDKNLTVLVANNSAGKTALLDIVSITFGTYIGVFQLCTNKGFEIINELLDNSEALNYFLDLELNSVNNNYFSFINLRREHFTQFKI